MTEQKMEFLSKKYIGILKNLPIDAQAVFGKMNVHQMIEHMAWSFKIANGKMVFESKQPPELTEKLHRFMMSDRPFADNTPNPNLPDNPAAPITNSLEIALAELENEIAYFIKVFGNDANLRIENPFFGYLNYDEQVHLLHKHALHHLRQFGVGQE